MTTPHERPAPRGAERTSAAIIAPQQQGSPAICGTCHSDQYLVYEEVKPVPRHGPGPAQWDVECWCGKCEEYQGFRASTPPALPYSTLLRGYGTGTWLLGA